MSKITRTVAAIKSLRFALFLRNFLNNIIVTHVTMVLTVNLFYHYMYYNLSFQY